MPAVNVSALVNGMVVAEAVVVNGKTVLAAGTVVQAGIAKRLTTAGVRQVTVTPESYGLASMVVDPAVAARQDTSVRPRSSRGTTRRVTRRRTRTGGTTTIQNSLLRVAHMFEQHRDSRVMSELCRLAIKCAKERLIRV